MNVVEIKQRLSELLILAYMDWVAGRILKNKLDMLLEEIELFQNPGYLDSETDF